MEALNLDPRNLFERYLQAVRKYLPSRRQDDIVAELRGNLEAQREEREAGLGRPLTEGEMIDWLKELGPPLEMAGHYQPPRYLIGPAIFPLYGWILRLVLFWAAVGFGISIVVRLFAEPHGPEWVAGQIFEYPQILIMATAWVTAGFAVLQFVSERYPEKCPDLVAVRPHWSPTSLPPLEKQPPAGGKAQTFATAAANFVAQFFVLLWILLIPSYPFLLMGPGAAFLHHAPAHLAGIVVMWYWTIVGINIVNLGWQAVHFLTGHWRVRTRAQQLTMKALELVPMLILLAAPGHIYVESDLAEASRMPAGIDLATVNRWMFLGVLALACLVAIQLVWDLWKQGNASGRRRAQPNGSPMRPA